MPTIITQGCQVFTTASVLLAATVLYDAGCGGALAEFATTDAAADGADAGRTRDAAAGDAPARVDASDANARLLDAGDGGDRDVDGDTAACPCQEEFTQVEGTCLFNVKSIYIACARDVTDREISHELDLFRSCIQSTPPPSFSLEPDGHHIELCNCKPGDIRHLCGVYR